MTGHVPVTPKQPDVSISAQAASGVFWLTVQKWAIRISGLVTIAVLTRVLSPQDFGTVAAASTVLPFFYLLSDIGFMAYIVQVDKVDRRMLSTSFWFSSLAGLLLAGALIGAAPLFGGVFGSAEFVPVLQVLSLGVVLTSVSSVPMALLRREMRFRAIAVQGTASAVVAQVVAVTMTLTGFGVWALVGQALSSQVVMVVLAWLAAKWVPAFEFSRREFSTMARFGSNVLGVEFIAMCRAWGEAAIISSTLGLSALGFLNIAQRLVQIVQDLTGAALVTVSTSAFAKIKESSGRLQRAYVRALRMTYAAMSPPLTLLAIAAPLILPVVFGSGWEQSARVAQVVALSGILVVGASLDQGLFYGVGKPGQWFLYAVIIDTCSVVVTAITAQWGLQAVAVGFLVVAAFATASRWFLVAKLLKVSPRALVGPFGFLAVAVLAGGGAGLLVLAVSADLLPIVRIAITGLAVLLAYLVVLRLLARQVIDELAGFIPRFTRATRFRASTTPTDLS
ncbi:lipopolysaccharide biosynthesis protein [Cryobacterium sp. MLB-32]|uniref:lipopolysaccharide biosynthesis protein n=1 Tax=Cryobacterium sp. MLB-32 TaxID=1529318 RepID=UPI00068B1131|nr:lipopolysaccharide biosynthesis protein [Cryobacterium sp. MLB-32]